MSTAVMQRKPHKRHKQHAAGHQSQQQQPQQQQQPVDYTDGMMLKCVECQRINYCRLKNKKNMASLFLFPHPDLSMPLSPSSVGMKNTNHGSRCGYEERGATLPRMGCGESRDRRGSAGGYRTREASAERRGEHDKHRNTHGGKGAGKTRQHAGKLCCDLVYTVRLRFQWFQVAHVLTVLGPHCLLQRTFRHTTGHHSPQHRGRERLPAPPVQFHPGALGAAGEGNQDQEVVKTPMIQDSQVWGPFPTRKKS